jgi:hypothetical protein
MEPVDDWRFAIRVNTSSSSQPKARIISRTPMRMSESRFDRRQFFGNPSLRSWMGRVQAGCYKSTGKTFSSSLLAITGSCNGEERSDKGSRRGESRFERMPPYYQSMIRQG